MDRVGRLDLTGNELVRPIPCVDRITKILPNTEEQRLRAAVEQGRRAKLTGVAGANKSQG